MRDGKTARRQEDDTGAGTVNGGTVGHYQGLVWWLVALGLGLRTWQIVGNASLWLDELGLARNLAERSYGELLQPLDYGQVAPPGFLLAEKFLWSLGGGDWTLRLLPFCGAVASVFLFRALALRALRGLAVPLAVGLFAIAVPFIMYGSQVKQYSTDAAVALGLTLLTAMVIDGPVTPRWRLAALGAAGFAAVWFSNTALFVLAGLGAVLVWLVVRGRRTDGKLVLLLVVLPWLVGCAGATVASFHSIDPAVHAMMKVAWSRFFAPLPPRSIADALWPWRALAGPFEQDALGYGLASGYLVLAIAGVASINKRSPRMAALLAAPVAVTMSAAIAQQYPFAERLILFLMPVYLLAVVAGTVALLEWVGSRSRPASALLLAGVLVAPVTRIATDHPVYRIQESRPLLAWVHDRWHAGDVAWVWYRAVPAVAWYGPRFGLTSDNTSMGACAMTEPRRYLREIDRLRGRARAWLLITGSPSVELRLAMSYADSIGVRLDGFEIGDNRPRSRLVRALLYNFSDSTRLATVSSESFPVPETHVTRGLAGCLNGPTSPRHHTP